MSKKILVFVIYFLLVQISFAQNEIPLKDYFRTLKSVEVEINGQSYDFLFDTGGGITLVSPQIIEDLGKSVYGSNVGFRMNGERVEYRLIDSLDIKINGQEFFHRNAGVFDIMSLLPKEFKPVYGVISLKTFENSRITLDLNSNRIIIETEESYREKIIDMDPVPSRFANGLNGAELNIFLGLRAEDRLWWFLFDSGNIAQTKISPGTARDWGISFKENELTELGSFKFEFEKDTIIVPTIIDDIIYDGALSFDFIRQSKFLISFEDKKVWKSR